MTVNEFLHEILILTKVIVHTRRLRNSRRRVHRTVPYTLGESIFRRQTTLLKSPERRFISTFRYWFPIRCLSRWAGKVHAL